MTNGLFSLFSSLIANTPPYRKGLSSRKFLSLFLILFLAVGNVWGETIVLSEVNSSDKWYEVEGVGRVTNKSGSAFSNSDRPCESQTSYKTGSNYFSVQTYTAISSLTVHAVSTSNRTLSGVAIGSSVASSAPSSIDENVSSPTSGTQVVAKNTCDNTFTLSFKQAVDANQYICIKFSGNVEIVSVTFTPSAPAGGADSVDPTFTYTPTTYTIGDPALDLSTKLTSNSGGAISFAVSTADAGTTGASIANGKDFTATTAGTATITVTQAETTGYNAKTQDIAVSVVEPDPCTTYYHFVATSDATANSKTNWSGFTNAPTGSNGQDNSVTIDGTTYTLKKRTGSTGKESTILGFTIPAGKVGTLYGYMKSSGSAGRTLSLKKGDEVVATNTEIVDGNWTLITIGAITSGTYTLVPNENVQIQMFALKVCDAVFHTVTFNSNGGSSVVEQSVLDGTTAIQPTDPERGKYTFLGWYNGETLYDWATPVASDLTLTAKWQNPWSITFDSDGGSEVETITVKHNTKAEKPSDPTKVNYNFEGWFYGEPATPFDWNANITQDYTLKAQWIDDNNVARIGDTYYTNLDEAVAYANENADAEIVLLKDIDRADRITLTKSTTINLNGNKLSKTDGGWLIFVKEGATLTINGETENSAIHGGISLGAMTNNNGSLVINGGTYTCADGVACVHVNGTCLESNVTIIGASLTSPTDIAIQLNGKGTYTITNATITGATGVYIKSGELTVTNSTIKGTKTPADYAYTGNGANATGDAIVVDACDYPGGAPTLNIISGTFEGTKGAVGNYNYNGTSAPAIGGIQGGTFNTEVPGALCADGYIPVKNGENNYGVTKTAKTFSLEDLVTTEGTDAGYEEYLNNLGWSVANANALDNLNTEKDYNNYPYLGLKFKSASGYVEGVVEGDKLLTIQLGHMAADADLYENGTKKVSLSGKDAETAAVHYYYVENQSTIKLQMTNDNTCVLKAVTVVNPFSVTFNTNGGDDIAAVQAKPSITLPEPTNGTMNFKGWYDTETGGNLIGVAGASYTPTGNIELHAQWEAQSTINTLSDLKVNGETVLGFAADKQTYRMVLPYKSALPMITSATPTNANATVALWPVDGPEWTDEYDGGCYRQQVVVTPQDPTAEKGYYDIRITYAPKDGVAVISIAVPNGNGNEQTIAAANITGYIGGTATQKLQSGGTKLGSNGHYIGFTLANSETLKEGDVIRLNVSATNGASHLTLYQNASDANPVKDIEWAATTGVNLIPLPAEAAGLSTLYIYRKTAECNPNLSEFTILRPTKPVLTAITFDGIPGVIDEAHKKVTVELPFSSEVASLEVEPTIAWNAPATTNSIVVNDGNWVVGDNTYVLTDKDGDQTTYTITLTQAAAIKEVNITGGTDVKEDETITLSATVIDTNDAEASNQNVTWTSNDETTATVDANGVVTGVKVGTVTITAISVADNTKSASVTITVTENPCRTWNAPAESFSGDITKGKLSIKNSGCSIGDVTPFSGASKVYAYKIDGSSDYVELSFTDKSQFETLTLGVSSGSNGSTPTFVVVASKSAVFDEKTIVEIFTYNANAKDAEQSLVDVSIPEGTRNVRIYRKYNDIGDGSSVSVYYVNACKKDFVPLTTVSVNNAKLGKGKSLNLKAIITPANADIESLAWSIESMTATNVTILGNVLTAAENATEGDVVVKVVATDVLSNVVEATATISIVDKFEVVKPVTATQVWNWAPVAVGEGETIADPDTVLANYISGDEWEMLAGNVGGRPYRSTSYKAYQGTSLYFKAAVPGLLIMYAGSTGNDKDVFVNGTKVGTVKSNKAYMDTIAVQAGDVYITSESMRIYWMKFDTDFASYEITDNHFNGYTRDVRQGYYGTICLPNGGVMVGASIFEIAYKDSSKIYFDKILSNEMVAGVPYIFLPNEGADKLAVFYTDEANASAGSKNGLVGSYTQELLAVDGNNYILLNNQYCEVIGEAYVGANRAYFQLSGIPTSAPAPAPGVHRVSMGMAGQNTATGVDQVQGDEVPTKMIINGQLFILRGEKMYDAQGKLVR